MVEINIYEIVIQIVNFLTLLFILQKFVYKPVFSLIEKRKETIEKEFSKSKSDREEASQLLTQQKEALVKARQEAQSIRDRSNEMAKKEYESIIQSAKKDSEQLVDDARKELNLELEKAKTSLVNQVGQLSVMVAEKALLKEVNPSLVDDCIEDILKIK